MGAVRGVAYNNSCIVYLYPLKSYQGGGLKMRPIDSEHKILFARATRRVVVWIVTILALAFTVLQVKGLSSDDLVNPTASTVMWRGALIAYF